MKWLEWSANRFNSTLRGTLILIILTIFVDPVKIQTIAQGEDTISSGPYLTDPNLTVQTVVTGLRLPTDMEFISENDLLVLEKNSGTVRRIVNDTLLTEPLLDVSVATRAERGMLGIAAAVQENEDIFVFLYFTESPTTDGADNVGIEPLGNRLYRYELQEGRLVNGQLLLDLPAVSAFHNGGKIKIGPDDNLYLIVGDQQDPGQVPQLHRTTTQNVRNSIYPDGTAGILRITQDGRAVENILGGEYPADLYYAYGIRNSFGIAFDPVTKKLWDTENGPDRDDEINLVEPGFNSGWRVIQGFADSDAEISQLVEFPGLSANDKSLYGIMQQIYLKFQGLGGKYRDPEFVWRTPAVPTGIVFLNSDKLGEKYYNDLLVGSFKYGVIYDFKLNGDRTSLELSGPLADKIENSPDASEGIIFGKNFGPIVDLEVGPDGYLYVLSIDGRLYRILTVEQAATIIPELSLSEIKIPLFMTIALAATILYVRFMKKPMHESLSSRG
jgi:aldose sugar dehydrogenase